MKKEAFTPPEKVLTNDSDKSIQNTHEFMAIYQKLKPEQQQKLLEEVKKQKGV